MNNENLKVFSAIVSPDDYKNYYGEDLKAIIRDDGNISNQAERFIGRVQREMINHIDANTFRFKLWNRLTPFQIEKLREAVIIQCYYVLHETDFLVHSGVDLERGTVIPLHKLSQVAICIAAQNILHDAGLFNLTLPAAPRFMAGNYEQTTEIFTTWPDGGGLPRNDNNN